ncbi:DUF4232 domain-containing protein [Streptomyces sp. NPDC051940]|uniref:DUF4232 domain-containing protein n=1 Tax=Streptomyces sp. NPDC051940 TaxID=3155675 RepID=UPI0034407495
MNRSRTRAALTAVALAGLLAAGCGTGDQGEQGDQAVRKNTSEQESPAPSEAAPPSSSSDAGTPEGSGEGTAQDSGAGAQQDTSSRPAWCATAALKGSLRLLNPAAGNRYTALVLTNVSDSPCRTQGYPGLQLVAADGRDLPTLVVRDRTVTPVQLTVRPGAAIWARLNWSQVPGTGDSTTGPCQRAAAVLEVIPPDQRTHTDVRWPFGEVCSSGRISVRPLAAGTGPAR